MSSTASGDILSSTPLPAPDYPPLRASPPSFRDATEEERNLREQLVGRRVSIYWEGDSVFYPGKVVDYDEMNQLYKVQYDEGDEPPYDEDLSNLPRWMIFEGTEADYTAFVQQKKAKAQSDQLTRAKKLTKRSFNDMVIDTVVFLAERGGSSLVNIRRHMLEMYPETRSKQTASFNSLTQKALNAAVAGGKLERDKHTYKASSSYLRSLNKRDGIGGTGGGGRLRGSFAREDALFSGSNVELNRSLRLLMAERRGLRDNHLLAHMPLLAPFLQETNNYFQRHYESMGSVTNPPPPVIANLSSVGRELALTGEEATVKEVKAEGFEEDGEKAEMLRAMRGVILMEKLPPSLKAELHVHQIEGISWMVHMFRKGMPMILGDQMGLGKTLQTIGLIAALRDFHHQSGPYLIVVPLSVLSNWLSEIDRFCPTLRAVRFHGPRSERERIKYEELNDASNFDVVITTFEMLVSESNFFKRKHVWTLVVVDEGHRLKNDRSLLSDKLRAVPALSRVILTGTPLQNNLRELWALLHFLAPDIFSRATAELFEEGFDLLRNKIDNVILRRARRMLTLFMLRRIKDQVAIKLPSRREITVLVPLTPQQVEIYTNMICGLDHELIDIVMSASNDGSSTTAGDDMNGDDMNGATSSTPHRALASSYKNTAVNSLNENQGPIESDYRKLMNLLLQLRKICNHTFLMPSTQADDDENDIEEEDATAGSVDKLVEGSGKLKILDRMLPRLQRDGHRVLLFSQFTSMLDILEEYCDARGWNFLRLDGSTNRVQRRLDVRRFNAPKSNVFIFLISTRAGGLGLNLATADTVILYDSDWNPQVDLQAMERCHRIGQTKPVRVFRLICRGSVEERMLGRAEKKLFLNAMVAEAGGDEDDEGVYGNAEAGNRRQQLREDLEDEGQAALGIGGGSMSKGELASLIRFGANAICGASANEEELSDTDLERLLESEGRDTQSLAINPSVEREIKGIAEGETVATAANIRSRLEMKEIDLRQLGQLHYAKKAINKKGDRLEEQTAALLPDNVRRERKSRITMVSGAGTGYGGAVPVLTDQLLLDGIQVSVPKVRSLRSRKWVHQTFCALCGNKRCPETLVLCAHCPKAFHSYCMDAVGLSRQGSSFLCPLHRCVDCSRSTVAAGGLLFRCLGCLTAYCEDCLPQDDIESYGRCRPLEREGYFSSHQAYYIKCPSCCTADGVKASGVDGSGGELDVDLDEKGEEEDDDDDGKEEDSGEENVVLNDQADRTAQPTGKSHAFPTQRMRVVQEYTPDESEVREEEGKKKAKEKELLKLKAAEEKAAKSNKKRARQEEFSPDTQASDRLNGEGGGHKPPKKPRQRRRLQWTDRTDGSARSRRVLGHGKHGSEIAVKDDIDNDDESGGEEHEENGQEEVDAEGKMPSLPVSCSLEEAVDLLSAHPLAEHVFKEDSDNTNSSSGLSLQRKTPSLLIVRSKVFSAKYRNISAFISDIRAILIPLSKAAQGYAERIELLRYFDQSLVPLLHL